MTDVNVANDSVCAIVVAYFPTSDLYEKIQVLQPQATRIVVIDNTPRECRRLHLKRTLQAHSSIYVIENDDNFGQAAALNQGLAHASKSGCKWILTLDQDTECHQDIVSTLLSVASTCRPIPMVIGSNYLDLRNNRTKVPIGNKADSLEQKTVITSGSLVDTQLAIKIGGFREDYFIDQVDREFCLRARANGGRVVISRKVLMNHSVGEAGGAYLPVLGYLPNHSPSRKYYIARNSLATITSYWRDEPGWCLRRTIKLILGLPLMLLLEQERIAKFRAFCIGIADGAAGRMGQIRRRNFPGTHSLFKER